jgi:hypothetical protein
MMAVTHGVLFQSPTPCATHVISTFQSAARAASASAYAGAAPLLALLLAPPPRRRLDDEPLVPLELRSARSRSASATIEEWPFL